MNAESCPRTVEQSCFSREGYRADNVISVMQSLDGRLGEVLAITSGYNDPIGTIDTAIDTAIDAVIDVPWTRRAFPDRADEFFCRPDDIANECWHIVHQPRSAWSFDLQIRPDGEDW